MNHLPSGSQTKAIELVSSGKNVFIGGDAGTGKSVVHDMIKELFPELHSFGSTGIAAINIGGMTVHSGLGIGICQKTVPDCVKYMRGDVRNRIIGMKRMAIDEISMLDGVTLDYVDSVMQMVRGNDEPFGGVQCVVLGDFLQLPMVQAKNGFAFESRVWKDAGFDSVHLTEVFRQQDKEFSEALSQLRIGVITPYMEKVFQEAKRRKIEGAPILVTHNKQVTMRNEAALNRIEGEAESFFSTGFNEDKIKGCRAEDELNLKIGARVMLISNIDLEEGLANGTQGVVMDFDLEDRRVVVQFDNGHTVEVGACSWEQSDNVELNSPLDEDGAELLRVSGAKQDTDGTWWRKEVLARKVQIPLKLSYAMTIHKSQGLTLDSAELHLRDCFEHGQAYVGVSRVRTPEGLSIQSMNPAAMTAHPKALAFYGIGGGV